MRDIFKKKTGGINTLLKPEFNAGTNKFTLSLYHLITSLISIFREVYFPL